MKLRIEVDKHIPKGTMYIGPAELWDEWTALINLELLLFGFVDVDRASKLLEELMKRYGDRVAIFKN